MNRLKLSYFVLFFLLTYCQHPAASPEKKENFTKVDFHQYNLPTSGLLQGKVCCFVGSTSLVIIYNQ